MKSAKELYCDANGKFTRTSNYEPIINSIGDIVHREDFIDFNNETDKSDGWKEHSRIMYKNIYGRLGEYGVLKIITFDSNCAFDALTKCTSANKVQELMDLITNHIRYAKTYEDAKKTFCSNPSSKRYMRKRVNRRNVVTFTTHMFCV